MLELDPRCFPDPKSDLEPDPEKVENFQRERNFSKTETRGCFLAAFFEPISND